MERRASVLREYFEALLIAGLFLGFTNTFIVKTFYIPSASMEDTLLVGDHLFVNRFLYGPGANGGGLLPTRDVARGDVVIFKSPERPTVDMVKRCVGLPGDIVHIVDKELTINGRRVRDDAYSVHRDRRVIPPSAHRRDNFGPYAVPAGHYFCLGDNRDHSYDSRFWGPVPEHFVKGRAFVIYWSYGGETPDGSWPGLAAKVRQLGATLSGFLTHTRWGRTLHLVR